MRFLFRVQESSYKRLAWDLTKIKWKKYEKNEKKKSYRNGEIRMPKIIGSVNGPVTLSVCASLSLFLLYGFFFININEYCELLNWRFLSDDKLANNHHLRKNSVFWPHLILSTFKISLNLAQEIYSHYVRNEPLQDPYNTYNTLCCVIETGKKKHNHTRKERAKETKAKCTEWISHVIISCYC